MSKVWARNWWGAAWVEKMQRLAESRRFGEGEEFARRGFVQQLGFNGRTITALVKGKVEPEYTVRISFDPFSRDQWERLIGEVRDREALRAAIGAGDLPLELQTAFAKAKLRFMPERYVDLHVECACPDWLKPCRHLVAVWLKFASEFDRDPFLVFQIRGLQRDELPGLLGAREPEVVAAPEPEEVPEVVIPLALESLPADPEAFWSAPALPEGFADSPERLPGDDDIFERLGSWQGVEPQLRQIYDAVYDLAGLLLPSEPPGCAAISTRFRPSSLAE
jgi:uncharacterized Zn finger protein